MAFSVSTNFKHSLLLGASAAVLAYGPAAAQNANSSQETVVVTGTRVSGVSAADSAAPITVLGADSLSHSGTENLQQALSQTVPSFNVATVGGDLANLTLTTNLRNLSPNDTLVLVNGKRRHGTANLNTGGGGAAPDLSLIPTAAIQHIEVLQDGAAAQYGTDAIAGVINIILKKNSSGGNISATTGQFYAGDGQSYDVSGNMGFPLFDKGFVDVTLNKAYHNFTQRGGAESHLIDAKGNVIATPYDATKLPGYPRTNHIAGDAEYNLSTALVNAGYDVSDDLHLYAFSTIARKIGKAYENARRPDLIVASPTFGVAGKYGQPGAIVFAPNGFNPQEELLEDDYSYAVGANGDLDGWHWDLSTVYGKDHDDINTLNSGNASLFVDTHTSPTNFYDGSFNATEWTTDLDISRQVNVGLASPLTVAGGFEARENTYSILAGDAASTYDEGGQSYPGFTSNDVGAHSRKNYGAYLDLAVAPIEQIQIDAAARFEHYTDFGDAKIAKLTVRWDITPQFAVRGTIDTGFRAPTLQEEYYTSTNVDPEYATVQLPADSPAAKVLGLNGLKPELSTSYSAGIVAHPLEDLSITLDGYSIAIGGRINGSPTLYGKGGAINSPAVLQAIAVNGNKTDPTVTQVAVSALLNGYSTNTKGVDLVVSYPTDFNDYGLVNWTLAGNYNDTVVTHIPATPVQLLPVALYTPQSIQNANHGQHIKVKLSANWTLDRWSANLVETFYGPYFSLNSPNAGTYYKEERGATGTTDLEIDYSLTDDLRLGIGGRNILNKVPEFGPTTPTGGLVNTGDSIRNNPIGTGYGPDGGYYYARIGYTF